MTTEQLAHILAFKKFPCPCKGCKKHSEGCKSTCQKWATYQSGYAQEKRKIYQQIKNEEMPQRFLSENVRRELERQIKRQSSKKLPKGY